MAISEELVASVVGEVSQRLADEAYAQVAVGTFVESHPDAARFVTARMDHVGGGEGVIHTVFHAQVLAECFERDAGVAAGPIGFAQLDQAVADDPIAALTEKQPALASYLSSNVEDEGQRAVAAHLGLALHLVYGG